MNAKTHKFTVRDKETGQEREVTCFDYFKQKYNIHLDFWLLPLLETTKPGVLIPMEVAFMNIGQRYPFKLNERQVCHCSFYT